MAIPTTATAPELARLIAPFDVDAFLRDQWEQKPLHVSRQDPRHYADLLTLDDLDAILAASNVHPGVFRVVEDGKESQVPEGPNALQSLYERYREGATIVVNGLDERWQPLRRLCRALAAESSGRSWTNVYLTPATSRGFVAHYDTHDVFIAQVHGTKRWRLYDSPVRLPLSSQPHQKDGADPGPPTQELDLRPGDVLYIPRGWVHDATSNDTASLHLTIAVRALVWAELIRQAVMAKVSGDVRYRKGLPMGHARDEAVHGEAEREGTELLDALRAALVPEELVAGAVRTTMGDSGPALRHHLTDLEAVEAIALDTTLRRRPELTRRVTVDDDTATLWFHTRRVRFPAHVAGELRFVAEQDRFTPAAIPGELDDPGRLVLARTLVREGFLTVS
jgi:ribosomal protein L16 Arg81 hydroxylase